MMKHRSLIAVALASAGLVWGAGQGTARAQDASSLLTEWGMSVSVGGGVTDFVDQGMRDTTGVAGTWDVRYQVGTRTPLSFEAAYSGSAQSIDAIGLDSSAVLVGTTVEGAARINLLADNPLQPYAFAGAAWRRYTVSNADFNTSDVASSDDVLEVPVGVGLAYRYRSLIIDGRFDIRFSGAEDLVPSTEAGVDHQAMNRYGINARIGYEF